MYDVNVYDIVSCKVNLFFMYTVFTILSMWANFFIVKPVKNTSTCAASRILGCCSAAAVSSIPSCHNMWTCLVILVSCNPAQHLHLYRNQSTWITCLPELVLLLTCRKHIKQSRTKRPDQPLHHQTPPKGGTCARVNLSFKFVSTGMLCFLLLYYLM